MEMLFDALGVMFLWLAAGCPHLALSQRERGLTEVFVGLTST